MPRQCNSNLPRAISVADYILEGEGHSIREASLEFKCGITTIQRDINELGSIAFYGNEPHSKKLQIKYIKVRKTLDKIAKKNNSNNSAKRNAKKKTTSN